MGSKFEARMRKQAARILGIKNTLYQGTNEEQMPAEVKFDGAQTELQAAIDSLMKRKDDSVKAFKDEVAQAHQAFDVVDGMTLEVRSAVSGFRAWLAQKTNGPQVEEAPKLDKPQSA